MPSANRPMISSGWRELRRVIRLSSASDGGERAEAGHPQRRDVGHAGERDTSPTITHGRNALAGEHEAGDQRHEVAAHARAEDRRSTLTCASLNSSYHAIWIASSFGSFDIFGSSSKPSSADDLLAQIGEAHGQRIDAGKLLDQRDADVFGVGPLHGVTSAALAFLSDLPS